MLEEDFLDLLAMMLREMPSEELWQMPSTTRSGASDALEAGMAGASMLTVRAQAPLCCPGCDGCAGPVKAPAEKQ